MRSALLCNGEFLKQSLSIRRRTDVTLHQQVHKTRNNLDHVEAEVFSVREQAFVRGVVAELPDGFPQRSLVCSKLKAVDSVVQCFARTAEMLDQALKGNTKQSACSPRRCPGYRLGFDKGLPNVFRHVDRRIKPAPYRPNNAAVLFKNKTATRRTAPDAEHVGVDKETLLGVRPAEIAITDTGFPVDHYGTSVDEEMVNDWVLRE